MSVPRIKKVGSHNGKTVFDFLPNEGSCIEQRSTRSPHSRLFSNVNL